MKSKFEPENNNWLAFKLRFGMSLKGMDKIAMRVGIDMKAPCITPEQAEAFYVLVLARTLALHKELRLGSATRPQLDRIYALGNERILRELL